VATKRKGCKTLKSEEAVIAERAIALWAELAMVETQLEKIEGGLARIRHQAARLGLDVPRSSAVREGDRRITLLKKSPGSNGHG